jgi:hypothetical protein
MGQALQSIRKFIDCYVLKRRWKEQFHMLFHTLSPPHFYVYKGLNINLLYIVGMFPVSMSAQTCATSDASASTCKSIS